MSERLLLDEHFSPVVAQRLRRVGFDVIAVAEEPDIVGAPDEEVYRIAVDRGCRVVTENVRDFRPLLALALSTGAPYAPLLLTTAKRHPRRASAAGQLVADLVAWLERVDPPKQAEEWL